MGRIEIRDRAEQKEVDSLWKQAEKLKKNVLSGKIDRSVVVEKKCKGKRIEITSGSFSIYWENNPRHNNRINCCFGVDGGSYSVSHLDKHSSLSTHKTQRGYSLSADEVIQQSKLCLDHFFALC